MSRKSGKSARVDGNQGEIVDALRSAGVSVQILAEVGDGCPDLLCGVRSQNFLIEVKDPAQLASDRQLTPKQKAWHREWKGRAHVVETVQQALDVAAMYRNSMVMLGVI